MSTSGRAAALGGRAAALGGRGAALGGRAAALEGRAAANRWAFSGLLKLRKDFGAF